MRKTSQLVRRSDLTRMEREVDLLHAALQAALCEQPDATEEHSPEPGCTDTYTLYRCLGPMGGIVVQRRRQQGQRDATYASYLDDLLPWQRLLALPERIALDRLRVARQRLWDADRAST